MTSDTNIFYFIQYSKKTMHSTFQTVTMKSSVHKACYISCA